MKKRYNMMSITKALETAKQRLTALDVRLKRHTREAEAERIHGLFAKDPSTVYSHVQLNVKVRVAQR